jgi:pimeloyl-ACP methyl ester carboxylesterase
VTFALAKNKLSTLALLLALPLLEGCFSFHEGPLPGEPKNASYTKIEGARIRYMDSEKDETEHKKPPVVLVHGFASSLDVWATVVPTLKTTHRVVSLDLKGFGWSDRPEGDYSPTAEARIVLGLMTQLGIAKAAVVGHSWGTSVTLATALLAPERVERIALYDAWVYEEQQPLFFQWSRAPGVGEALFGLYYNQRAEDRLALAFYDNKYVTEGLIEIAYSHLDKPGTMAAHLAAVRGQRYAEIEQRYKTIRQKTLLLYGREDGVTLTKYGERLLRELPTSRMVVYPNCGHFPMLEAASASTRDLHGFLLEDMPKPEAVAKLEPQNGSPASSPAPKDEKAP